MGFGQEEPAPAPAPQKPQKKRDPKRKGFDIETANGAQPRRVKRGTPLWTRTVIVAGVSLAVACILVGVLVLVGGVTLKDAENGGNATAKTKASSIQLAGDSPNGVSSARIASVPPVSAQADVCSSSCDSCYAAAGATHCCGIRDADCARCASGYPWWPCGPDTISKCLCGSKPVVPPPVEETPSPPSPTPPPQEDEPVTPSPPEEDDEDDSHPPQQPPTGSTCTAECDTCVAAPGAANCCGVRDEHCALCASGYKWWPCDATTISKCLCKNNGEPVPAPTPAPTPPAPSPPGDDKPVAPSPPDEDDGSLVCNQTNLGQLISRDDWDKIFPHRNNQACKQNKFPDGSLIPGGFFEYDAFIEASASYKCFLGQGSTATKKRELAAFLAQISHETTGGWPTAPGGPQAWGLCWKEEVGCEQGQCTQYCAAGDPCTLNGEPVPCPCAAGKTYHGRGPMQLSWNYNYAPAGVALRNPLQRPSLDLLANPEKITEDPVLAFATAIFFWMTPRDKKPACHDVMTDQWTPSEEDKRANRFPGFGVTTNVINGGLECNIPNDYRVEDRVQYYLRYSTYMGVSPGDNLYCDKQRSFY